MFFSGMFGRLPEDFLLCVSADGKITVSANIPAA